MRLVLEFFDGCSAYCAYRARYSVIDRAPASDMDSGSMYLSGKRKLKVMRLPGGKYSYFMLLGWLSLCVGYLVIVRTNPRIYAKDGYSDGRNIGYAPAITRAGVIIVAFIFFLLA